MKKIIKETKKSKDAEDTNTFYRTEKVKDINGVEFTIKKELKNINERQLLIEKEQAESVIAEFTDKLNEINEILTILNKK